MKINEIITESLNNPYPHRWDKKDVDHWVAKADMPAGLALIMFELIGFKDSELKTWGIDFAINGRMGKSGEGDEFRIFATVVTVIKDWVSKMDLSNVETIRFAADKDADVGTSRSTLYKRFAKQMANQLGWEVEFKSHKTDDIFHIKNPNAQVKEEVNEEVEVSLYGDAEKGYTLSKIEVSGDERNAGQGTKAMQDIIDRMDREGAVIALTPDDAFGGNKNRLIKFYKRFGFVPNKGRNKDFRFRETMIRYPQTNESAGVGRIVKGVNTTVDVGPNEIVKQAKKWGNDVDRNGKPKNNYK